MTPTGPGGYHPADPVTTRDPYAALRELRRTCPVARLDGPDLPPVTLVSAYADARAVYRDYRTFGNIGFYPSTLMYDMTAEDRRTIIELDPPRHTAVRRLNLIAMKPAAIDVLLPHIEAVADDLVGTFVGEGGGDVVSRIAIPLPADAIAAVLGLPAADAALVHQWVATLFSEPALEPATGGAPIPDIDSAFDDYLLRQIAARRSEPHDDAIGRMADFTHDDGTTFSDDELVVHIRTILMAGNETTTSLISNAVHRLLTVPGTQDALRDDESLIGPFLEECLRIDPPLTQFPRRCLRDGAIGDVPVEQGEIVSISIVSTNRDEAVWGDDAEEFRADRFTRDQPDHLSFGLGVHFCIGAYLARHTAHIAVSSLLRHTERVALADGYEFDKVWFFEFFRPKRLDVVVS